MTWTRNISHILSSDVSFSRLDIEWLGSGDTVTITCKSLKTKNALGESVTRIIWRDSRSGSRVLWARDILSELTRWFGIDLASKLFQELKRLALITKPSSRASAKNDMEVLQRKFSL